MGPVRVPGRARSWLWLALEWDRKDRSVIGGLLLLAAL
jgi:hypothetical protein